MATRPSQHKHIGIGYNGCSHINDVQLFATRCYFDHSIGVLSFVAQLRYLYYYSSPLLTNLSSKFDGNLPVRSHFDSVHRVIFSTPTSCQSAIFVRPLFAFVFWFFTTKNHKKNHKCGESVSIGVIDQVRSANVNPNALLHINR